MDFYYKYIKYKSKYIELKKLYGGDNLDYIVLPEPKLGVSSELYILLYNDKQEEAKDYINKHDEFHVNNGYNGGYELIIKPFYVAIIKMLNTNKYNVELLKALLQKINIDDTCLERIILDDKSGKTESYFGIYPLYLLAKLPEYILQRLNDVIIEKIKISEFINYGRKIYYPIKVITPFEHALSKNNIYLINLLVEHGYDKLSDKSKQILKDILSDKSKQILKDKLSDKSKQILKPQ